MNWFGDGKPDIKKGYERQRKIAERYKLEQADGEQKQSHNSKRKA